MKNHALQATLVKRAFAGKPSVNELLQTVGLHDRLAPRGGEGAFAATQPQKVEPYFRDIIPFMVEQFKARPGVRGIGTVSHAAGGQLGHLGYPNSRFAQDPAAKQLWAEGVTSMGDTLQGLQGRVCDPDVVGIFGCNNQGADLPLLTRDALGKDPPLLVASPKNISQTSPLFREALAWGMKQKQPWLFPQSKTFHGVYSNPDGKSGPAASAAWLSPRIPTSVSVPTLAGAAGVGLSELLKSKKEKRPWVRRLLSGAAGVGLGHLLMLQLAANRRRDAIDGSKLLGSRVAPELTEIKTASTPMKNNLLQAALFKSAFGPTDVDRLLTRPHGASRPVYTRNAR